MIITSYRLFIKTSLGLGATDGTAFTHQCLV